MKKWMQVLLMGLVLVAGAVNAQASTVTVGWGPVSSYTTVGKGSMPVAQFNLTFDGLSTYGFCVEPTIYAAAGANSYNFLTWTENYLQAAWLMDAYAQSYASINTRDKLVAIQSSIWNAVTDNAAYMPVSGDSASSTASTWYNSLPATFNEAYLKANYKILNTWISARQTQTLIIKYPSPVPVPVPAAVWMLGTGLVGVMGMRWRQLA